MGKILQILPLLCTCLLFIIIGCRSSEFPTTLKGYGYAFNDAGQLRQINPKDETKLTDKPYDFQVYPEKRKNQERYEALGNVITETVYQMLIDAGLQKIYVPSNGEPAPSFVFGTKPSFENTKKLMIFINGAGVVRAGQWSRSLIINHSVDHGTQLPYIKRAIAQGYDVLVTNTNNNYFTENGKRVPLNGNRSPEEHIETVWKQLIGPVIDTIESFGVVAHSYGGVVTLRMADKHPVEFMRKCFAIGFTDSVHSSSSINTEMRDWFKEHARNYVTSPKPLGEHVRSDTIPCYSAGHTKHEWTSWACFDALFPFLEKKYKEFIGKHTLTSLFLDR